MTEKEVERKRKKKKLLIRTGILFAVMGVISIPVNEGWTDGTVAHPLGAAAFWIVYIAIAIVSIFWVVRPWMRYLSESDSLPAKVFTTEYRLRQKRKQRQKSRPTAAQGKK